MAVGAVAAVVVVAGLVWLLSSSGDDDEYAQPMAKVVRGPLTISITADGEIESAGKRIISNELRRTVTIEQVVPENSLVPAGKTIIKFGCKDLLDDISRTEMDLVTDANVYTEAHENLLLKKKELAHKVRQARQAVRDAKDDLTRYIEGEGPLKLKDAESAIALAEQDLLLAREKLNFKLRVNADPKLKSPYSANEVKADKLKVRRLELALEQAMSNRQMLVKYDHPRQKQTLADGVTEAELALERAGFTERIQLLIASATETAKKHKLESHRSDLQELRADEAKLTVKADTTVLVIYDTGGSRWRPNSAEVKVGESIRPHQQVMIIPDMSSLQIETTVFEADKDQVHPGQRAYIRLNSKPGFVMNGRVIDVDKMPAERHRWENPDVKLFTVRVAFDEGTDLKELTPGLTARVQIELARLKDVLHVPVAAVFTDREQTYCRRWKLGKVERVAVTIGRMSDKRIVIAEGLEAGDSVLLVDPERAEKQKAEEPDQKASPDESAKPPAVKPPPAKAPGKGRAARGDRKGGASAGGSGR